MISTKKFFSFSTLLMLLFLLFGSGAFAAQTKDRTVIKEHLKNGMTVIIQEEHSAPVVALQMWVRVGSAYETEEEAGLSHVFEHMLFKGTVKRKVGELAKAIESVGGNINAYTSFDNTVYHLVLPSRHFSTGLDVISDSIQHSAFDPDELKKELEVVLEELRMNKDRPGRNLFKSALSTSFTTHPYGRPVIGYDSVISGLTRDTILEFFSRWYVPNNMTLVIAGDVDTETVLAEVKASFKDFKKKRVKKVKRAKEPVQYALRTSIESQKTAEAHFALSFRIPDIKHKDTYAIDVLESVLGGSETSRLYKDLKVESALVHSISSYAMTLKDPGLFLITGVAEAQNIKEIVAKVYYNILALGEEGPSEDELKRVRLGLESSFIYSRESMQGIASKLGYYETTLGDLKFEKKYLAGIKNVTAKDVKRVLKKYLTPQRMSVSVLLPEPVEVETAVTEQDIKEALNRGAAEFKEYKSAEATDKKITTAQTANSTTKQILPNGMTLIIKERHANPTVAFYAAVPGGLRFENSDTNGVGNFTASMLRKGTRRYDYKELVVELEELAGGVSGFSGWNSTGVSAKFLSRDFDKGMDIFKEVLTRPTFPEKEIENIRNDLLAAIKRQEDSLGKFTFKLLLKNLYKKHPYGMPTIGTKERVSAITRDDLVTHYNNFFVPDRMVLTVVGDVDTSAVIAKVTRLFEEYDHTGEVLPTPPTELRHEKREYIGKKKEKEQTHVVIGFLGTSIGHKDSYALRLLSEILSGQGGRLFINLRDKLSLAYSVHAFLKEAKDLGIFAVYIGTAPDKKEQAIKEIYRELTEISTVAVTEAELNRAKNSIIGGYELGLQSVSNQAGSLTNFELYGQGYDFQDEFIRLIEAVTTEDILHAAQKYLKLNTATVAVVGPGEESAK